MDVQSRYVYFVISMYFRKGSLHRYHSFVIPPLNRKETKNILWFTSRVSVLPGTAFPPRRRWVCTVWPSEAARSICQIWTYNNPTLKYHIPPFRSSLQFFPFSINNVQFDGGPDPGLASRRPPGQLFNLQVSLKFPVLRPISAEFGHLGSGHHTTSSRRAWNEGPHKGS